MGLLLCTKDAGHPLYYEKLDINIWSIQELCYVICNYPVIVPDDLVNKKLCAWFRDELGLTTLAARMEQMLAAGETQEDMLTAILLESNYYTSAEVSRYRNEMKRLHSIDSAAFSELLGDTFFRMGRFGKAVGAYQDACAGERSAALLEKLAASCARVMQFDKAAELYEEVYRKNGAQSALKQLYYLKKLEPGLSPDADIAKKAEPQAQAAWEAQFAAVQSRVDDSERVKRINALFEGDRQNAKEEAARLIRKWKQEYREKV